MLPSTVVLSLLLSLLLAIPPVLTNAHLLCSEHPAHRPHWPGVLIRSWRLANSTTFVRPLYLVRWNVRYLLHPNTNTSKPFPNLDFFYISGNPPDTLATLHLQRSASIFLFVGVKTQNGNHTLPGWQSLGYAERKSVETMEYGIHQRANLTLSRIAYVFMRTPISSVNIPSRAYIRRHVPNIRMRKHLHVRIGEVNGQPTHPTFFKGNRIRPNARCPDKLHATWTARHPDHKDPQLRGRHFATWHPSWDPCFWCAYDHEHGSSPTHLMRYQPTYGYAALKNGRQQEDHTGFKGFVFREGAYFVYFSLHVRTSSLRRARTRLHTIELVIVVARTGERVMEITHKADYGFLAARARKSGFIALTKKGEKMEKKMVERKKGRFFRTMNIVNERNLDKRFRYRSDAKKGVYEEWITVPMCVSSPSGTGFNVDIKDPATGMKRIKGHKRLVRLGRKILNVGVARKLRLRSMTVGQPHCNFGEDFKGGVFYTDAQGKKLVKGPGPAAIRQFIKPGFSISLNGNYELGNDKWFGLFEKRERGFRSDSAFGLDPLMN